MNRNHRPDVPSTAIANLVAALLAALAATLLVPVRAGAQVADQRPVILDQYLSRARLDRSVLGDRARLEGIGFRLTRPLAVHSPDHASPLADRLAVGGFVTYARAPEDGLTAWHFGAHADLPLRAAELPATVEPLVSLGLGALRGQYAPSLAHGPSPLCTAPTDLAFRRAASCVSGIPRDELAWHTRLTIGPAVGLRMALGRGIGLRTDVRDVIVFRDAARHNFELATGLSFVR